MNVGQAVPVMPECKPSAHRAQALSQEKMCCPTEEDTWLGCCPSGDGVPEVMGSVRVSILTHVALFVSGFKSWWIEYRHFLKCQR